MIYTDPIEPPQDTFQSSLSWMSFNPGDLKQDIVTLPLEAGIIGVINAFYTPKATPVWPFNNEYPDLGHRATSLPGSKLLPYALGSATLVLGGLTLTNDNFFIGTHMRGWLHAILLTEIATSTAKISFQRKRPFYDNVNTDGPSTYDNRFSFFSGHSSHAFSFATYSSALMFEYSNSQILNWSYAALSYSAATWIASSRVKDHAHNVSDVVVGGLVGTLISAAVFYRVENTIQNKRVSSSIKYEMLAIPYAFHDENNKSWYGANFEIKF
ncbi:MAG: phosphatase PAP2 family protein [Silvanigrellaceae bacterium]|nr:phosphatase PAP2 family protein [Silvanigrellaceae bacterium]